MKVIDLLNKIANGEEVPKKIRVSCYEFEYNEEVNAYFDVEENSAYQSLIQNWLNNSNKLNSEVEIIEEQQDIDIQSIEDLPKWVIRRDGEITQQEGKRLEMAYKINELAQAVKQLDKKIKEQNNG